MLTRCVVIVLLATCWALAPSASAAALCGDSDGNGALAINDVVRHLRVVSSLDSEAALCGGAGYADCADLNGDGAGPTDISDTVVLLRRASNVPNCAPDICVPNVVLPGCPGTAYLPRQITGVLTVPAGCDARLGWITFVEPGAVLRVAPGSTIRADHVEPPALLVVRPGARIDAVGTAAAPITWTSSKPPGTRMKEDWGGIAILGRAPVNQPGISLGLGDTAFGGTQRDDFSGCMVYNRIAFAGQGLCAGTCELDHLLLAGVGSRTVLHHIHAHLGTDDCFGWFGGTVSATHLIASACGDDSFDHQLGWTGGVQFGVIAQRPLDVEIGGSNGIEMDNSDFGADDLPRSDGKYCNVTAIGARYSGDNPGTINQFGIFSRRGNAMTIANTIVKDFRQAGYQMRDAATAARACVDPTTLATTAPVGVIRNSLFADNGAGGTAHAVNHSSCDAPGECACTTTEHFALLQSQRAVLATTDPAVEAIGGNTFPSVDLVPPLGSLPATHPAANCSSLHPAFIDAPYIGAFEPGGEDWTAGWADYPLN